jgi:hypothetical protein
MKCVLVPNLRPISEAMPVVLDHGSYVASIFRHANEIDPEVPTSVKTRLWCQTSWTRLTKALFNDAVSVTVDSAVKDLPLEDKTIQAPALYGYVDEIHTKLERYGRRGNRLHWRREETGLVVPTGRRLDPNIGLPNQFSIVSLVIATHALNDLIEFSIKTEEPASD